MDSCEFCSHQHWCFLPFTEQFSGTRSDGSKHATGIVKKQCMHCGVVVADQMPDECALQEFYTNEYDRYHKKPASENYTQDKYRFIAAQIAKRVLTQRLPIKRVLEVGCGNGSVMVELQKLLPACEIVGIEPVTSAYQVAQKKGLNVVHAMAAEIDHEALGKFDVVYSINVIEHTASPSGFLQQCLAFLKEEGLLMLTCPDASEPSLDLMHADHLYSFLPVHLRQMLNYLGLADEDIDIESFIDDEEARKHHFDYFQFVQAKNVVVHLTHENDGNFDSIDPVSLYRERSFYLQNWIKLQQRLESVLEHRDTMLYCFGAGGWAALLANYAPDIWQRVDCCVVDGGSSQEFHGKKIIDYNQLKVQTSGIVIAAVHPKIQPRIKSRLQKDRFDVITWDGDQIKLHSKTLAV